MLRFNFDAQAGETPASIAQKRALVAQLMGSARTPTNLGEGFSALGDGIVSNVLGGRADDAEKAGRSSADDTFSTLVASLTGKGAPRPSYAPQTASDATAALAGGGDFMSGLIDSESGGNWQALNDEGYGGRLQFGDARLADAAAAGLVPQGTTGAMFSKMPPEVQQAVEQWHFSDIDQQAANMGLNQYFGQTIAGVPINQDSIRSMAHLGGIGGAQKFIASGGQYNPADSNGTRLSDYGSRFGGGSGAGGAPVQVAQGPDLAMLMEAAANPWLNESQKAIINSMISQQMQQQDPAYQMGLEKSRLELEALRNPGAPKPIEVGGVLVDAVTFQPIFDSRQASDSGFTLSPGQQRFDAQGNPIASVEAPVDADLTDTQRNLEWRASEAGLVKGTPEYAEFMRSGGQSTGMALTVGPDGTVQFSQGGANGKPLTEGQSKDAVFVTRANNALPTIDKYENALLSLGENVAGNIPYGNYLQSEEYQVARDAGREFLATVLRKDTGAAVTPSEESMYGDMLLPRPGDKPATIEMKRRRRAVAVKAIEAGMPPQAILNSVTALQNAGVADDQGNVAPDGMNVSPPAQPAPGSIDALLEKYR